MLCITFLVIKMIGWLNCPAQVNYLNHSNYVLSEACIQKNNKKKTCKNNVSRDIRHGEMPRLKKIH